MIALVGMVVAFTIAWSWLMVRRYQLARIEWQIEEHGRLGRISAARRAALATSPPAGEPVAGSGVEGA